MLQFMCKPELKCESCPHYRLAADRQDKICHLTDDLTGMHPQTVFRISYDRLLTIADQMGYMVSYDYADDAYELRVPKTGDPNDVADKFYKDIADYLGVNEVTDIYGDESMTTIVFR